MIYPFAFRRDREKSHDHGRQIFRPFLERRETRSALTVAVMVVAFNSCGRVFHEMTATRNVSRGGCCIYLHTRPQKDTPLAIRILSREGLILEDTPPLTCQLVWSVPVGDGWGVGASAFADTDLMRLAFPGNNP